MNTPNGFNIRFIDHNSPEGIIDDLQSNIQININGQSVNRDQFFQQSAPRITLNENTVNNEQQDVQSNGVVDPASFFGSSFSGLLNQIKKS